MTYDSTNNVEGHSQAPDPSDDPPPASDIKGSKDSKDSIDEEADFVTNESNNNVINNSAEEQNQLDLTDERQNENGVNCYNQLLNDEIRSRLDKLNALSDLINTLERKFDEANCVFKDTLKCSASRLDTISRALGSKSIKYGRVYNAAKISVEQSQAECQRACVQFEKANIDHQSAKKAIKEAELKLKELAQSETANGVIDISSDNSIESLNINNLKLTITSNSEIPRETTSQSSTQSSCDNTDSESSSQGTPKTEGCSINELDHKCSSAGSDNMKTNAQVQVNNMDDKQVEDVQSPTPMIKSAAHLSEELNKAILRLKDAESNRGLSEKQHLDQANKLMVAQEKLLKLERDYGQSIRRSQLYFDESRRINAQLNSLKCDIDRIRDDILDAKQAYARTLSELEQFSDNLHVGSEASRS